jgi:hypothetical protein
MESSKTSKPIGNWTTLTLKSGKVDPQKNAVYDLFEPTGPTSPSGVSTDSKTPLLSRNVSIRKIERNVTKKVLKHFDSFAHLPSNVELLVRSNIDELLFIEPGSKIITPNNNEVTIKRSEILMYQKPLETQIKNFNQNYI